MMNPRSLVLFAALLLAGCVNVHVHFPSAPPAAAEPQKLDNPQDLQKKP
jgi:PBP1b-binding outer membrane lipoprotein LpoB